MLPSIAEMESLLNINDSQQIEQIKSGVVSPTQPETGQASANLKTNEQQSATSTPVLANEKYAPTQIQTYQVTVADGKLVVTGKPTPYGSYNKADGVILDINEQRANKKTTLKVPFSKGTIHYEYPLSYTLGDVILNLDEYYNGKTDDPNQVLGYAQYHLTDGEPIFTAKLHGSE